MADAHHARSGKWPTLRSGVVVGGAGDTWASLDRALRKGSCGLSGGNSIARLLAKRRGVRNRGRLPPLTYQQIVAWAKAHRQRTGSWPRAVDGSHVPEAPLGETWKRINNALEGGYRGLPGGSSLVQLCRRLNESPSA